MTGPKEGKSDESSDEDEESLRELKKEVTQLSRRGTKMATQKTPLDELCAINGIKFEKLEKGAGKHITSLEMFFSGFPRIIGMQYFPNLKNLTLMGQQIQTLENLDCIPHLTELCVSESQLDTISGLTNCKVLKKLFLYGNKISKIENISHLEHLSVLWLNDNIISKIEGLDGLIYLIDLNLAGNRITQIGNSFDGNPNLKTLDLSANFISSLKDLTSLAHLPRLESLSLRDPVYGPNPVALLCNYSTYLLYHLPSLRRLDSCDVDNKILKDLAEIQFSLLAAMFHLIINYLSAKYPHQNTLSSVPSNQKLVSELKRTTVVKKKMYYNMRVKTLLRNKADMMARLEIEKANLQASPKCRTMKLFSCVKDIEKELEEEEVLGGNKENKVPISPAHGDDNHNGNNKEDNAADAALRCQKLQQKKEALLKRIAKLQKQCDEINSCHQESYDQVNTVLEMSVKRLGLELETGGNVRFEDGKISDPWYKSCHDLVLSRFCVGDYVGCGVAGIKVHRITRVHNRALRMRFDDKLDKILDSHDIMDLTKGRSYKKLLEYLFLMWNPSLLTARNELQRVLEEGFGESPYLEGDGGVPLANSFSVSDKPRVEYLTKKAGQKGSKNQCPFRHGQLIVAKVFVGKSTVVKTDKKISRSVYPGFDSVYRPRKHENCPIKPHAVQKAPTTDANCECNARQCAWYIFDHEMVLPEYVVDFEYITKVKPCSSFIYYYGVSDGCHSLQNEGSDPTPLENPDEDMLSIQPVIAPRPRLIALTEEVLLKQCRVDSLEHVTTLNLHGNGLTRLKHLSVMTALKKLTVSFNDLTRLDEISHMLFLEHLDVSFNKITTLEGLKGCNRLRYLDVSWNQLRHTREELGIMRKHVIGLTFLDTRSNPWQKAETLRMRALGRLKNLEYLDGIRVSDGEMTIALKMAAASRPSSFAILAHAWTDQSKPRTLGLVTTAHAILASSQNRPVKVVEDDSQWFVKVTTVNLDNQHLGKLTNMEQLVNLRWASFNNNDLTKIEGLEACLNLEELSIENNCISKFEGLGKQAQLTWLSLAGNNLTTLDTGNTVENLPQLRYLSLENNAIISLRGLQNLLNLQELYIGNNQLSNIREVFHLKSIPSLLIVDLCGNPVAAAGQKYRLFVIYHVTSLKALDGLAVEPSDGSLAKDTFGGRLTPDFIAERLGHSNFSELRELDLPHSSLRTVDLGTRDAFYNLRSVNLEHNSLISFGGLVNLINLKVLCLNYNHIESLVAKPKTTSPANSSKRGSDVTAASDITNPENFTPVLPNLEVLHLGYNGITNMATLQLSRLTNLRALFLQGNEISKVEGLEGLQELRELVLDRNKIKNISGSSFVRQWNLTELHMEENRVRELENLTPLQNLQRLYLGMNRIQDISELEKLECLTNLIELSVINNAVTRRLLHRPLLVYRMPNLLSIDGIPVSGDERTKAGYYFIEQQGGMQSVTTALEPSLPGIVTSRSQAPLRVTTVQLSNSTDRNWSNAAARQDFTNGALLRTLEQQDRARRRGGNTRGVSSHSLQTLSTTDSSHSLTGDRYGRTAGSLVTSSQPQVSTSVPYIPHGTSHSPYMNGDNGSGNRSKTNRFK